jgi:hypothetical protein
MSTAAVVADRFCVQLSTGDAMFTKRSPTSSPFVDDSSFVSAPSELHSRAEPLDRFGLHPHTDDAAVADRFCVRLFGVCSLFAVLSSSLFAPSPFDDDVSIELKFAPAPTVTAPVSSIAEMLLFMNLLRSRTRPCEFNPYPAAL